MESIPEFFTGRTVFITGATGFVGKVLLEKLLFSCPNINRIYVLIRPKKNKGASARLSEALDSKLFSRLQRCCPHFKDKVHAMEGDVAQSRLGLSDSDYSTLIDEVSVFFHSAATVKFDEPLRLSILMNVTGVRHVLEIAHKMTSLEALVQVSTAYCNCDNNTVKEQVYETDMDPSDVIATSRWLDDEALDTITGKLIYPKPNTYTFTKALGEKLLMSERGSLPCCIVRPSIVGATLKEPFPGWVEGFNGPSGLMVSIGKGLLQVMSCGKHIRADLFPVDICVNVIIAAAWRTAKSKSSSVEVYHATSGHTQDRTWGYLGGEALSNYIRMPLDNPIRIPSLILTQNKLVKSLLKYKDFIPALLLDLLSRLRGKPPVLVRRLRRFWTSVESFEYFTTHDWHFVAGSVEELRQELELSDEKEFPLDVSTMDWAEYVRIYCKGVKIYLLKEKMEDLRKTQRLLDRMIWTRRTIYTLVVIIGWRVIARRYPLARSLFNSLNFLLLNLLLKIRAVFVKDT